MLPLLLLALAACDGMVVPPPDLVDPFDTDEPPPVDSDDGLPVDGPPPREPGNVLFLLVDDFGVEMLRAYGVQDEAPPTPTLDALAEEGVLFERAYTTPWCSPTRAAILTGLHPRRFGIGAAIEPQHAGTELPDDALTIPEALAIASQATYTSGLLGKWHLSTLPGAGRTAALQQGFDTHVGTFANLQTAIAFDGRRQDFFSWERIVDDTYFRQSTGYLTSVTIDDVADFVATAPEPWFAWVGLHAAHTPWHAPPAHLHTYGDLTGADVPTLVRAMIEALDTEIGRLLDGMDPDVRARTTVVVAGDNGSTDNAGVGIYANRPAKSTVYEAGVRVPLIVAGRGVREPGARVEGLVQLVDLFPTFLELGGVDLATAGIATDGVSLLPFLEAPATAVGRDHVVIEAFVPNGPGPWTSHFQTVREPRWKLIRRNGRDELYDMAGRILEGPDLLRAPPLSPDAADALLRLTGVLGAWP